VQLSFKGGPWANRLVDSAVDTAPPFVAPAREQLGVYRRTEPQPDSPAVVYEWSPHATQAPSRRSLARVRFGLEVVGAVSASALAILTLISRNWIEVLTGIGPDHGSGALEWSVVFALLATSMGLTFSAQRQWRRMTVAA
jgi:hypothetical protein